MAPVSRKNLSVEQVQGAVKSLKSSANTLPADSALKVLRAKTDELQSELAADRADLDQANKSYSPVIASLWNPVNWAITTDARAYAKANVWPKEAEVEADETAVGELGQLHDELVTKVLRSEHGVMLDLGKKLRQKYGDDIASMVVGAAAETGKSAEETIALVQAYLAKPHVGGETAAQLAATQLRLNAAYQEAGVNRSIGVDELYGTFEVLIGRPNIGYETGAALTETFAYRLLDLEQAVGRGVTSAERDALRTKVEGDFGFFCRQKWVDPDTATVLTGLVGSTSPSRDTVKDHFEWFAAKPGVDSITAAVYTSLVAPFDATDTRAPEVRRQEVLDDQKVVEKAEYNGRRLSSSDQLGALASYRDPSADFATVLAYYWFFNQVAGSGYGSSYASAGLSRDRYLSRSSTISSAVAPRGFSAVHQQREQKLTQRGTPPQRPGVSATTTAVAAGAVVGAATAGAAASRVAGRPQGAAATKAAERASEAANRSAAQASQRASASANRASQSAQRASANANRAAQSAQRSAASAANRAAASAQRSAAAASNRASQSASRSSQSSSSRSGRR